MATRTSRARRSRSSKPTPAPAEGEAAAAEAPDAEPAGEANGKLPSHLTPPTVASRANLNGLLENYGELRRQVVQIESAYKRGDKDLDARIFQCTKRLDALEKKLNDFRPGDDRRDV